MAEHWIDCPCELLLRSVDDITAEHISNAAYDFSCGFQLGVKF